MAGAEQQTNITIGANAQPYVDSLKQAQAATTSFGQSLDQLTASSNKIISEVTITAQGFARLRSSLDPAVRSAEQYAAASSKINAAVNVLNVSQGQANQLLDLANQKYKTVEYQAQQTAKAQQALAAANDKQIQADLAKQITAQAKAYDAQLAALYPLIAKQKELAEFQKNVNFAVSNSQISPQEGATQVADFKTKQNAADAKKAAADVQAAMDAQTKAVNEATVAYDNFRASIDPVVAAQQKLAAEQQAAAKYQQQLNVLVNAGRISSIGAIGSMQQWQVAQKNAGDEGKKLNGTLGISSYQLLVIGQQFRQLLDQVIAGGGFLRPLAMQAPVVIENLNGVGNSLRLLRNNIGLIAGVAGVGLAVGALVALGVAAERNERSINSLANGLQKFGGDFQANALVINAAAKTMAETTALGTQEARDAMAQLATAPGFKMTKDNLIATTKAVQDMAAGMGVSTQEAAKFVTTIFADPVAAAMDGVNKHVDGFTNNFVASVKDMVNQGKQADAINTVFNKWATSMKGAGDNVTPLQKALHDLSEAFTGLGNSAAGAGKGLGTGLTNALAGVINDVTSCVKFLGQMSAAFEKMGVSGKTQIELVGGLLTLQLLPGIRNVEAALVKLAAVQFASLIAGLNGVQTAVNGITITMARNPVLLALITAMTAYQMIASHENLDVDATATQMLGYKKQQATPGGYFTSPTYTYTDPSGKPISSADLTAQVKAFATAPVVAQQPAPGAASDIVSTVQGFGGKTGADLNTWLNANGAQIDAAKSAWCAAFVNSALASVGIKGTGSNLASSFLNFSEERATGKAQAGDVIVQPPQAKGTSGHVGIYTGRSKVDANGQLYLEMTSGNEGGQVATTWVSSGNISSVRALPGSTSNVVPSPTVGPIDPAAAKKAADEQRLLTLPNSLEVQRQQLEEQKKASLDLIASGTLVGDALDKEQQHVRDLDALLYKTVEPITLITRAQDNQLQVQNELNTVQQKVTEAVQQYDEAMRSIGKEPDPAEREKIRAGVLNELGAEYRQLTNAADMQAASEGRIADAWEKGAAAAQHQMNAEKARQAIAGNSPTITLAQAAAIEKYTEALDKNTAAQNQSYLAQEKLADEAKDRLLDVERSTEGASAKTQATTMAAAQRIEELKAKGIDTQSQAAQEDIARKSGQAAKTVDVQREKQAWTEVDNAASQALDDMGDGLNSFLSTGKWSDFGNAAKKALSDITSELIKMAVLAPLKNLLGINGGNNASIFDLFNNTGGAAASNLGGAVGSGGMFGGGGGGGGSGLGALGGLGGMVAGAFGKTGLFGSEGLLFGSGAGAAGAATFQSAVASAGVAGGGVATGFIAGIPANFAALDSAAALDAAALPAATASEAFLAGGLYHEGGIVGHGGTFRVLPASAFIGAPHFAQGGVAMPLRFRKGMPNKFNHGDNFAMDTLPPFGNDEVPAILHRGEKVLTPQQQRDAAAQAGRSNRPVYIQPTFNISTPDADSFRKSKNQINAELIRSMTSATRKI